MRLKAHLGNDAFWVPPRLWAYAAENQPDGNFSKYTDEEVAAVLGYSGDAPGMLQALLRAEFMDADRKIHGWAEHNHYHAVHKARASAAAKARWKKERTKERTESTEEIRGEERRRALSIPPSNAPSMLQASPNGNLRFPKDFESVIKALTEQREHLKNKGAHINAHGTEWHNDSCRKEYNEIGPRITSLKKRLRELQ